MSPDTPRRARRARGEVCLACALWPAVAGGLPGSGLPRRAPHPLGHGRLGLPEGKQAGRRWEQPAQTP